MARRKPTAPKARKAEKIEPAAPSLPPQSYAPKKAAFLAAFGRCGVVSAAAKSADIVRKTHYNWLEGDKQYEAAFKDARAEATEMLELEARRRAHDGCRRLKFHEGQPIMVPCEPDDPEGKQFGTLWLKPYVELEYSDTLLIFLLKANDPLKFREKVDHKHEHEVTVKRVILTRPEAAVGKGEKERKTA